jgi:methylated-DNA-[protein]-cysteine S-methyltransferase
MYYTRFNSPVCEIILAGDDEGLTHLHLNTGKGKRIFEVPSEWVEDSSFFDDVIEQVDQYFEGERKSFTVNLNPQGTDFQKMIWRQLVKIPYGTVCTYKDIARAIGNDKAARAVGMANSKNPIPLIVPCHRVIGSNGGLTGFAHGLEMKAELLKLEGNLPEAYT